MTRQIPILAQAVSARNMHDGSQTQHRTLMKPQPNEMTTKLVMGNDGSFFIESWTGGPFKNYPGGKHKAPWRKGDTLWVRECWKGLVTGGTAGFNCYAYRADNGDVDCPWRPSIHMPKDAARTFLLVKRVWCHRIGEITEAECMAEGVRCESGFEVPMGEGYTDGCAFSWLDHKLYYTPRDCFQAGWESIYPGTWPDAWVWAEEHELTEKPEGWA